MDLRVKLNVDDPTLYELSFFSLDLLRLNVVSSLIEEAQDDSKESKLVTAKNIDKTYLNRASLGSFYKKNSKDIQVKEFKEGSIELVIAGTTLAASIIVPSILYYLNKRDNEGNEMVNFTIDSNDQQIAEFLNEVSNRNFGSFDECFEFIRQTLVRRGYNFEAISDNTYKALKANSSRLEDVILTTRRIPRN
ncbi:TPA: hypothetical protein N2898_004556 [Vibrio parahaemolyticus]|uniref:Uncharacterized protein n=1 Tax=Vibrio parahaemolyticus TaxID=670 RepID=A0AA46L0Z0_VIBPH|nr:MULTISPECIES: hypothetical protein [Vibrio harveyi group]MCG6332466.1 hypothetical protein [Vibrio alginolyticus]MCG6336802.1 hypothetical protein [Vibrio alginolyticus]MCG6396609.1 hypothetical protein [Vibrio alginolyticus]MDG2674776.1 hypothetical protein [Vibrio parahaemolyticus]TXN13581.1 hypothetical protein FVP01_23050 [Vibrio parahaemolyticus]